MVAQQVEPIPGFDLDNGFIIGSLIEQCAGHGAPGLPFFNYVITYDDSQLISYDPDLDEATDPLTSSDIHTIVCIDCFFSLLLYFFSIVLATVEGLVNQSPFWSLQGNSNTTDGVNFLGTTDNVALDIRVNNERARRTVPSVSPIIIDGYSGNNSTGDGSAVLSGGGPTVPNTVLTSQVSTIVGGQNNTIQDCSFSSILGGVNASLVNGNNSVLGVGTDFSSDHQFIGGIFCGQDNHLENTFIGEVSSTSSFFGNSILSGRGSYISAVEFCSIVSGGAHEIRTHDYVNDDAGTQEDVTDGGSFDNCIVSGGFNKIFDQAASVILSGVANSIDTDPTELDPKIRLHNIIGSGYLNQILSSSLSQIVNGLENTIENSNLASFSFGGRTFGGYATILNGVNNHIVEGSFSTILGGGGLIVGETTLAYQNPKARSTAGYATPETDLTAFTDLFYLGDMELWLANTDNTARQLKFFEPNTDVDFSSTHYSSFRAQAQASNIEYVWPAAPGVAGQVLKIQSVVGPTVTLEWANDNT